MQQAQQREGGERISWARALIFAVGFFFLSALLIGQLPSFINTEMTSASLVGLEQGLLALAYVCLGGFLVVQAIAMLFDPKPVVPPAIFAVLGLGLSVVGAVVVVWTSFSGNQLFPGKGISWAPIWGGAVLWFPEGVVDLVALGAILLFVGLAWLFYSFLAMREQGNPDRRDLGTTRGIRTMIILATVMLIVFMFLFTFVSNDGLAQALGVPLGVVNGIYNLFLIVTVALTLGAFALRLHYLMRPVRKNTMKALYAVGFNLAPIGVICLVAWFAVYPFIFWLHSLPGLGTFFTVCARKSAIPLSCGFSQEGGNLVGAIVTTAGFSLLIAASLFWKTKRNLIIIGGVTITALLSLTTLLTHIEYGAEAASMYQPTIALMICGGGLILATLWTSVARREFAVVGEKPLGCLGMWLVMGTCLFVYIASFAFFSIPGFHETESNIPFFPGALLNASTSASTAPKLDAVIVVVIIGILAAIHFYYLVRNRYRV